MRSRLLAFLVLVLGLVLSACGDDGAGPANAADAAISPDAAGDPISGCRRCADSSECGTLVCIHFDHITTEPDGLCMQPCANEAECPQEGPGSFQCSPVEFFDGGTGPSYCSGSQSTCF